MEARADLLLTDLKKINFQALSKEKLVQIILSPAFVQLKPKYKDLSGVDLSDVDLSNANLSNVNFSHAILRGATLSGATLAGSTFIGADLGKANLSSTMDNTTDLRYANFSGANLSGANLTQANLYAAYFANANLTDAILTDAELDSNCFAHAIMNNTQLPIHQANFQELCHSSLDDMVLNKEDMTLDDLNKAIAYKTKFYRLIPPNNEAKLHEANQFFRKKMIDEVISRFDTLWKGLHLLCYSNQHDALIPDIVCLITSLMLEQPLPKKHYESYCEDWYWGWKQNLAIVRELVLQHDAFWIALSPNQQQLPDTIQEMQNIVRRYRSTQSWTDIVTLAKTTQMPGFFNQQHVILRELYKSIRDGNVKAFAEKYKDQLEDRQEMGCTIQ